MYIHDIVIFKKHFDIKTYFTPINALKVPLCLEIIVLHVLMKIRIRIVDAYFFKSKWSLFFWKIIHLFDNTIIIIIIIIKCIKCNFRARGVYYSHHQKWLFLRDYANIINSVRFSFLILRNRRIKTLRRKLPQTALSFRHQLLIFSYYIIYTRQVNKVYLMSLYAGFVNVI